MTRRGSRQTHRLPSIFSFFLGCLFFQFEANGKELRDFMSSSIQFEDMSDLSHKDFQSVFALESQQFPVHLKEQPDLDQIHSVSIRILGTRDIKPGPWARFGTQLLLSSHMTKNTTIFGLNELYLQFPLRYGDMSDDVTVGRRMMSWSDTDRRWNLGLFESKLYTDGLRTESQGLTGIFAKTSGPTGMAMLFATPVTIPSQGPDIQEDAGNIRADNRWYQTPTKDFQFQNSQKKIDYRLDIQDRLALANHGGVAGKLGLGDENQGIWLSGSYAYKAMNDLLLQRENYLETTADAEVKVTVRPVVGYHSVYALQSGYTANDWNVSLSYLYEHPGKQQAEVGWVIQQPEPVTAYSVHWGLSLEEWVSEARLIVDYLHITGGKIVDLNSEGQPDDLTFMDRRFSFYQPLRIQAQSKLYSWSKQKITGSTSYLYDFEQEGSLVRLQLFYHPNDRLVLTAGADVLGVNDSSKENSSTGFLNRYRANDRGYAGIAYVF